MVVQGCKWKSSTSLQLIIMKLLEKLFDLDQMHELQINMLLNTKLNLIKLNSSDYIPTLNYYSPFSEFLRIYGIFIKIIKEILGDNVQLRLIIN